ncbi:MAG: YceD family protein, partial [Burkholderiaceae bacterium]|nr:YceD family protein [Burkholderiaceae bacterium]
FLFAPDEAQAARLDERAEDDVLASVGDFDLLDLIEDELLLALPLAPCHDRCPQPVRNAGFDAGIADKPHPFAALAALKNTKRGTDNL